MPADGGDEHGGSAFLGHDSVVGVQSSWLPPTDRKMCRSSSRSKSPRTPGGVVRADDLGLSLHGCPSPANSRDDCGPGIGAQIVQLAGAAGGDEPDNPPTRQGVFQDSGVDH